MVRQVLQAVLAIALLILMPLTAVGATQVGDGFAIYDTGSVSISGPGVRAVAVQPWDGKVVIGGDFTATAGTETRTNLARLNTDGTLDLSFDRSTDFAVNAIAISPNDADTSQSSIVIGGNFTKVGGVSRNALARIRSGDALLEDFDPITSPGAAVNALLVPSGGNEVIAGGSFSEVKGVPCGNLARISLVDSSLVSSFAGGVGGGEVSAIALQKGKVVIGGSFAGYLSRFTAADLPDASFQVYPDGPVRSLAVQEDGKILLGGDFTAVEYGPLRTLVLRSHLARGDGSTIDPFDPAPDGSVGAIAVQPDGAILIGGAFAAVSGEPRSNLARVRFSGAVDTLLADTDLPVLAIALQPDGKFLAGGEFGNASGKPRSRLARFYPQGALDDDIPSAALFPGDSVFTLAQQPDGGLLVGGAFWEFQGKPLSYLARLDEGRSVDLSYGAGLSLDAMVKVIAARGDGGSAVGGFFVSPSPLYLRLDSQGAPAALPEVADYNARVALLMDTWWWGNVGAAISAPDDGRRLPDGTPVTEGMFYVGGDFTSGPNAAPWPYEYLTRLNPDGTRDVAFQPAPVDFLVYTLAVQDDGKLLVGGSSFWGEAKLKRLNGDGSLDLDLLPDVLDGTVTGVFQQPDGRIVAVGAFDADTDGDQWRRCMLRFNGDGTLDNSLNIETFDPRYSSQITGVVPQTDGSIVIYGIFESVRDASGTEYQRDYVARLNPDGGLDPTFDLGDITYYSATALNDVVTANLQPDGKLLIGGEFLTLNGKPGSGGLARVANGWATQELSVSPDGSAVTWRRDGTGPELWRVWFETSDDRYASSWKRLGEARRVDGVWRLDNAGLSLPDVRVNRYVRARGYVTGDVGGGGSMVESVRLFYLDPKTEITVTADKDQWTFYGDHDFTITFTWSPPDAVTAADFTGSLSCPSCDTAGTYPIEQGTLSLDPSKYILVFKSADFAVKPKEITVTAVAKEMFYGDQEPEMEFTSSPALVNGDTFTGSISRASGDTVGTYPIGQGTLSLDPAKYSIVFNPADFTVKPKAITVTAEAKEKFYGDLDPGLTYSCNPSPLNNDNFTGNLTRAAGEGVSGSPYAILQGTLDLGPNYVVTFQPGALAVKPRDASVTAVAAEKIYGADDPSLSATAVGILPTDLGPDRIAVTALRDPGESAGTYPLHAAAADNGTGLLENYAVQYHDASFLIKKAPLTITAENKSRLAGEPNPELTARYDGFTGSDTPASLGGVPLLSTEADVSSVTGSYPIRAALGSIANTNYDYSFVDGVLTVTGKATQAIDFPPLRAKTFGDGDFDPGATASSGLPVSYASSAPEIARVVDGKLRVVAPGEALVTASQPGNDTYAAAADVTRALTVNPPPWNGLGFDGVDDAMVVADGPQFNFGGSPGFTVEAWLRLDGSQPDGTGLVSKGEGGDNWSGFQLVLYGDRIAGEIAGGGTFVGTERGLVAGSSLDDGNWHHVALAVDRVASTATLYFDGRVEAQVADPAVSANTDNLEALLVGADRGRTRFFKGEMDEVRVWGSARSREEIRAEVSRIIDPAEHPQLAAYFHLDEGDAGLDNAPFGKAPDRTAHGADGTPQGFALSGATSNWIRSGAFLPLLETSPVSSVSDTAATAAIVVYPNYYPPDDVGLCWSRTPRPTLADSCSRSGSGTGSFAGVLTGLVPGATYYVRGFATNVMGTAYGNEVSFGAARRGQAISLEIEDRTYGDAPFDPGGTSTSGLPVTYASSNPEVARVADNRIVIVGAGNTVITASQGGDGTYAPAPDLPVPFTVRKAPLAVIAQDKSRAYLTPNPELTAAYQGFVYGEDASVLSGAPALWTAAVQQSAVGSYPITAAVGTLAAANYSFVPVPGTLSVFKSCQEINFPPIPERTFGDPPFDLVASACSGLPLTFASSDPAVAQVNGATVTITGAGSAVITASQGGDGSLETAPDGSQVLVVHKSGQVLTFSSLAKKVVGDPPFELEATASSGLPVSYRSSDPEVARVEGATVTPVGAGTAVISALQPGDGNYNAALPVPQTLTVAQEGIAPVLSISTLSSGSVTSNPVLNLAGTAVDASGIATLTVNGTDRSADASLFSSAVPLLEGENAVSVSALDRAGNRTTQVVNITLDALAPEIGVSDPADNGVTDDPSCVVSGSVTPGSSVTLWLNGADPQLLQVADGRYSGTVLLLEGVNTLEVAAGLSGRTARAKRSVTYAPLHSAVAITDPGQDLRTESRSLTLRGRVGEGSSVLLDVNGATFTVAVSQGEFQREVELSRSGENRVRAVATGSDGARSVAFRNIVRIERIAGDLDLDGSVDISDASALLKIALGLAPPTPEARAHGDLAPLVNGVPEPDGVLDVGDLLVLLRKIVGLVRF